MIVKGIGGTRYIDIDFSFLLDEVRGINNKSNKRKNFIKKNEI